MQISESEFEIMKIIWEKYPISTNEIVEQISKTTSWNARTIQTLITRLNKKGAVGYEKQGRLYVYSPLINKDEYIKNQSESFLKKFYNGAINKMVLNFINNDMLSEDDIKKLKDVLDERK